MRTRGVSCCMPVPCCPCDPPDATRASPDIYYIGTTQIWYRHGHGHAYRAALSDTDPILQYTPRCTVLTVYTRLRTSVQHASLSPTPSLCTLSTVIRTHTYSYVLIRYISPSLSPSLPPPTLHTQTVGTSGTSIYPPEEPTAQGYFSGWPSTCLASANTRSAVASVGRLLLRAALQQRLERANAGWVEPRVPPGAETTHLW